MVHCHLLLLPYYQMAETRVARLAPGGQGQGKGSSTTSINSNTSSNNSNRNNTNSNINSNNKCTRHALKTRELAT